MHAVDESAEVRGVPGLAERFPVLRALRHRNYRLFLAGQLVSLVGTWMQSVAQLWLVYRLTGSSSLLGLVGFAGQFPVFLLSPLGGSLADTHDRHRIIVIAQTLMMLLAFVLAGLTLTGLVQLWHVVGLAILLGLATAFDIPARQAFVVEMVGRDDLMNAIALNSSMVNGARILGPSLAGACVAAFGEGWCFFVNGLSFLAVLTGLLSMQRPPRPERQPRTDSTLRHMGEGLHFALTTAPIRALLLVVGVVSLTGMSYSVLMPIFVDQILHGGPKGLGLLMGCSGVGALGGALTLAARSGLRGLGLRLTLAGAGFGLCLFAFSESTRFWLSALILLPAGFAMMFHMAAANTLIQSMVPDRLRGRVMAVYSMMFIGMATFGTLMAGLLADRIGAPATVRLGGTCCFIAVGVFFWRWRDYRDEARLLVRTQQEEHAAAAATQA